MSTNDPDFLGYLEYRASEYVKAGYLTRDEIVEALVPAFEDVAEPHEIRSAGTPILDRLLAEHAADQRSWPETTDCDRLTAAFAELESRGILARENYLCCGSCGHAELRSAVQARLEQGLPVRGYTFFHEQSTEGVVESGWLGLAFGDATPDGSQESDVAHEVVDVLKAHGLNASWSGDPNQVISVRLKWQRRTPVSR